MFIWNVSRVGVDNRDFMWYLNYQAELHVHQQQQIHEPGYEDTRQLLGEDLGGPGGGTQLG